MISTKRHSPNNGSSSRLGNQLSFFGSSMWIFFSIFVNAIPGGYVLSLASLIVLMLNKRVLDALLGVALIVLANPVIFEVESFAFTRWLIIIGFALFYLYKVKVRSIGFSFFMSAFGLFLLWSSIFVSPYPVL
jgi:hypothetical protein